MNSKMMYEHIVLFTLNNVTKMLEKIFEKQQKNFFLVASIGLILTEDNSKQLCWAQIWLIDVLPTITSECCTLLLLFFFFFFYSVSFFRFVRNNLKLITTNKSLSVGSHIYEVCAKNYSNWIFNYFAIIRVV